MNLSVSKTVAVDLSALAERIWGGILRPPPLGPKVLLILLEVCRPIQLSNHLRSRMTIDRIASPTCLSQQCTTAKAQGTKT